MVVFPLAWVLVRATGKYGSKSLAPYSLTLRFLKKTCGNVDERIKISNAIRKKNRESFCLLVSCGHTLLIFWDNLEGLLEKCWALTAIEEIDFSSWAFFFLYFIFIFTSIQKINYMLDRFSIFWSSNSRKKILKNWTVLPLPGRECINI